MIKLRYVCMLLLASLTGTSVAQTFYQIDYVDKQHYENHGLMLYTNEEECTVLIRRHTSSGADFSFQELAYQTVNQSKQKGDEVDCQIMACEEDNTPLFIWIWESDESDAQKMIPYVELDEDDEPEDWVRATTFRELSILEITPEFLDQFIDSNCRFYKEVCQAHQEAVEQQQSSQRETKLIDAVSLSSKTTEKSVGETVNIHTDKPIIHLILVANTEVSDIGSACQTDYNNMLNEMRGISQSLNITLKEYSVSNRSYSKASLQKTLQSVHPRKNDIVIFLYSGHGFRFSNQKDPYPMIALTTNDYQPLDNNYVAMSEIYAAICEKGARLNIVLSDCCNADIGERRPLKGNTLFSRGSNNFSRQRLADLFFNAKGSILSTAASPGEYSWCDEAGGMFTLSFIQSLRREISTMKQGAVTWQNVVDNTIRSAGNRSSSCAKRQNGLKKMAITKI